MGDGKKAKSVQLSRLFNNISVRNFFRQLVLVFFHCKVVA